MRSLLLVSAVIALVAVAAPSLLERYLDGGHASRRMPAREAMTREVAVERPDRAAASSGRQVQVEAARDGHFYVDAEINFRRVRLVVDTGATVVALRESDAASAGIRVRPADFQHPVQTANGTTNAAQATLDSVAIDDIEVRNVRALVLPDDDLSVSLLGGSFLNDVERYEVTDGVLVIEN
jgi:aspartyl protease family protein